MPEQNNDEAEEFARTILGRLRAAHHELHNAMTALTDNKDYAEAERLLRKVDKLLLALMTEQARMPL